MIKFSKLYSKEQDFASLEEKYYLQNNIIDSFRKANYEYLKKIKELEETLTNQKVNKLINFQNEKNFLKNKKLFR